MLLEMNILALQLILNVLTQMMKNQHHGMYLQSCLTVGFNNVGPNISKKKLHMAQFTVNLQDMSIKTSNSHVTLQIVMILMT